MLEVWFLYLEVFVNIGGIKYGVLMFDCYEFGVKMICVDFIDILW